MAHTSFIMHRIALALWRGIIEWINYRVVINTPEPLALGVQLLSQAIPCVLRKGILVI